MPPVTIQRRFTCTSTPEDLWGAAGDTDRLNRISGMMPVTLTPNDDDSAARFRGETRLDGFAVEYLEEPARWEYPRWYTIRREIQSGPLRSVEMTTSLSPVPGGTEVTIALIMEPISAVLEPISRFMGARRLEGLERAVRALERQDAAGDSARAPIGRTLAEQLSSWLASTTSAELGRIRPFALADRWGVDRRALLRRCLEAVGEGSLSMRWELVCPSCRVGAEAVDTLSALGESGHCQLCDLDFELSLDRSVEAVFSAGAGGMERYCPSGPALTPHVLRQAILPPGGEIAITAPSEPGRYRLFIRGGVSASVVVSARGVPAAAVRAVAGGVATPAPLMPGGALTVTSGFDDTRHLKLEETAWRDAAATAWHVSLEPAFRRTFSADVLAAGTRLAVSRVALMFTDLTHSTTLYDRLGDAAAYRLVRAHFELLEGIIEARGGAVVKTIGDAVMAAFPDGEAALAAAVDCQRGWPGFLEGLGHRPRETRLRIGVHAGPCYAVEANGVLDYFGQTVNTAARVEASASGGEIAITEETIAGLGGFDAHTLPEGLAVADRQEVMLKGLRARTRLVWLTLEETAARLSA